jgi:hypothetical protein
MRVSDQKKVGAPSRHRILMCDKPHPPSSSPSSSLQARKPCGQSGHDIVVKAIVDNEQNCPGAGDRQAVCSRTRLFKMAIVAASPGRTDTRHLQGRALHDWTARIGGTGLISGRR